MRREDGTGWGFGLTPRLYRAPPRSAVLCDPVRMPEPAQPLSRLRLLGAVGSASAVAAFALEGPGPSYSYALLTPVLAGCGGCEYDGGCGQWRSRASSDGSSVRWDCGGRRSSIIDGRFIHREAVGDQ